MPCDMHRPLWKSWSGLVLLGFLAVAGFYLVTEHTAHLLGVLPFLLLLACPVMHLFMHHGHGGHGGHEEHGGGTTVSSRAIEQGSKERVP